MAKMKKQEKHMSTLEIHLMWAKEILRVFEKDPQRVYLYDLGEKRREEELEAVVVPLRQTISAMANIQRKQKANDTTNRQKTS